MADRSPDPDASEGPGSTSSTPRWVKVFAIISALVILLFVILLITGSGGHGPGRHMPPGAVGSLTHMISVMVANISWR